MRAFSMFGIGIIEMAILAVVGLGIIGGITAAVIVSTSRSREE